MTARRIFRLVLVLVGSVVGTLLFRGFPDLDIGLMGIRYHRYFAFHSAAVPLALYVVLRRLQGRGWLSVLVAGITAGAGLAIGIHLLFDVFQPKSVVFPFFGTPLRGTLLDDQLWFLANSVASFAVGRASLSRVLKPTQSS